MNSELFSACVQPVAAAPASEIGLPVSATANRRVVLQRLGRAEYVPTWEYQEQLLAETLAIKTRNRQHEAAGTAPEPTPNHLLLCEHPPVYTLGKSGKPEHLLLDEAGLLAHQATFHRINRGGDITYHGPGQLVGYPIIDLENFKPDIHFYLRMLEEAMIRMLAEYGLNAGRIAGLTGVWVDYEIGAPNPRKICAMGVKCSRWVTMHGFALNVNTDLAYFSHIVPCGITDKAVTSLQQELGRAVTLREVEDRLLPHLAALLSAEIVEQDA